MDKVVDDYNIQLVNYLFCLELKSLFTQNNLSARYRERFWIGETASGQYLPVSNVLYCK